MRLLILIILNVVPGKKVRGPARCKGANTSRTMGPGQRADASTSAMAARPKTDKNYPCFRVSFLRSALRHEEAFSYPAPITVPVNRNAALTYKNPMPSAINYLLKKIKTQGWRSFTTHHVQPPNSNRHRGHRLPTRAPTWDIDVGWKLSMNCKELPDS